MSDETEKLLAREAAQLEDTKRFNAERELALLLAPEKWAELKRAFSELCAEISAHTHSFEFECEESGHRFQVNKVVRGTALPAATFTFEPRIPAIRYEIGEKGSGVITFAVSGQSVFFTIGRSGFVLRQFVGDTLMRVMKA